MPDNDEEWKWMPTALNSASIFKEDVLIAVVMDQINAAEIVTLHNYHLAERVAKNDRIADLESQLAAAKKQEENLQHRIDEQSRQIRQLIDKREVTG